LRALTADDMAAQRHEVISAAEIMSRAPLVLAAQGVDVVLDDATSASQ